MAVSTENQRRSVQGYSAGAVVHPKPDAPLEGGHLAHVAWLSGAVAYSAAAATATGAGGNLLLMWRRRTLRG